MKRFLFAFMVVVTVCVMTGCSHSGGEPPAAAPEKSAEPESRVKHGTNGAVIVTLGADTQKVMGLQVAVLVSTELSPEVKGFGRVLDPATLTTAIGDWVSAGWAADASQKELARLKTLAEQGNAPARALESANAAAVRDSAQADAARARLRAATSKSVAERDELAAFARSLAAGDSVLVRIDLPVNEILRTAPTGVRLVAVGNETDVIDARFVGAAPGVDPQTQAYGYLFLIETNQSRLVAGAAVTGFLKLSGPAQAGVTVPRSAVVRFNGATWVYLQTGDDTFERVEVALDRPLASGWFIAKGLKADAKIVAVGSQQLLSEELKGQGGGD